MEPIRLGPLLPSQRSRSEQMTWHKASRLKRRWIISNPIKAKLIPLFTTVWYCGEWYPRDVLVFFSLYISVCVCVCSSSSSSWGLAPQSTSIRTLVHVHPDPPWATPQPPLIWRSNNSWCRCSSFSCHSRTSVEKPYVIAFCTPQPYSYIYIRGVSLFVYWSRRIITWLSTGPTLPVTVVINSPGHNYEPANIYTLQVPCLNEMNQVDIPNNN